MATRHPDWIQYDLDYAQYLQDLEDWLDGKVLHEDDLADRLEAVKNARKDAESAYEAIRAVHESMIDDLESVVRDAMSGEIMFGGEDGAGLIRVDPDRIIESRIYVATYVTDWGEESEPSEVSDMVELDQNDSIDVTISAPPAGRNIEKWRLYRSNSGSQAAGFQFVDEMLISTLSYRDELKPEHLGESCPTFGWAEPPFRIDSGSPAAIKPPKGADPFMRGAVGMPNGIVAGFVDNFVAFCHPYHPYAWPVEYQITTEFPIVGLGVFGQTLFVGTKGNPYLISGSDSASMSAIKLDADQACVSRRSIASIGGGVVYASPDGLCLASQQGVQLATADLYSREEWQALNPASIVASTHDGIYYFWCDGGAFALEPMQRKLGRIDAVATAVHKDIVNDHLFAVVGDKVKKLFAESRRVGKWRSATAKIERQMPLAWLQVDGEQTSNDPVTVRWIADGTQRYEKAVTSREPVRLPAGRWQYHEIEIEGSSRVVSITMAGSTQELQGVA